jgi:ABC-type transport system involved in multi-copper enzyme maturation permease subunit
MRQEMAILLDSFRLLLARKLFWVSLSISGLVALAYASIGFTEAGMSFGFGMWDWENPIIREGTPAAETFYLLLFSDVIVRFWLAWFAVLLALVSCASIFPEFLKSGSVDLFLSKPIGRTRLFLWKYLGSLLFVAVQVLLFSVIAFLAIGVRLGDWNFSVFWAVPLVTFVFSLVYCVAVLIGVTTRSTLFALLGAIMFWGLTWMVQFTEDALYQNAYMLPEMGMEMDVSKGGFRASDQEPGEGMLAQAHGVIKAVAVPLPKTRDTTMFLKRLIRFKSEGEDSDREGGDLGLLAAGDDLLPEEKAKLEEIQKEYQYRHSTAYVIWTSAGFEFLVLALAAGWFARRDY